MSNLPERVTASMRAADVDRMRVAQLLSDAAAQGRLELSEFEQRLAKVYSANTYGELDQLSADLPDVATSPVRGQGSKPAPSTVLMAIMSGFERRGRWNVPGKLTSFALWGGGVLDLRYADFTSNEVEIRSFSIMGGQTIPLPPEVNVDVKGVAVMGGFDHSASGNGVQGAPHVTVKGFSLWGGVNVKRKRRKRRESLEER
ncbi:DUF1707 domain-containing protein [Mycobacteroides abscessus subsp. abscessus]